MTTTEKHLRSLTEAEQARIDAVLASKVEYVDPHPTLKGDDLVRDDCGKCSGSGYYHGPSRISWNLVNAQGEVVRGGTLCFDCNGRGFVQAKVSSIRARVRRQVKAQNEARETEAAWLRNAPAREAADLEAAYEEAYAEKAERDAKQATRWLGEEGEVITVEARIAKRFSFDGHYGVSYLWILETKQGDVVTCYSSAKALFEWEDTDVLYHEIVGTVKNLNERDGVKQTQIARPRIVA